MEYGECCNKNVGAFTVWKKSESRDDQVIDARCANTHFEVPEGVALCTGSAFSLLEVEPGSFPIQVGVDIADAFYHIELLEELREYFALPSVKATEVGLEHLGDKAISGNKGCTHASRSCRWDGPMHYACVNVPMNTLLMVAAAFQGISASWTISRCPT